jgi:HEAT repeat protein
MADTPAIALALPPPPARGFTVFALPGGLRMGQVSALLLSRPVIAGDLVIGRVPGSVVAWALTGQERWRLPDRGFNLVGAARDGGRVVITLGGAGMTVRSGMLLVVDATTGLARVERRESHAFGAPTIVGDDVFVPWDAQNLSIFDARTGEEVARVRSREDVIGFARREGNSVWFGARALHRFGYSAFDGRSTDKVTFTQEGLPGAPPFAHDPYVSRAAGADARERVRLAWRADGNAERAAFAGATVYSLFHRDVFALDASTGEVRWAFVSPADIAGSEVSASGITVIDENGRATRLDVTTGQPRWRAELGAPTAQAVVQLPADFAPTGGVTGEVDSSVVEGLLRAAGGSDTRLMPAQLFALRALAAHGDAEATHALVTVLTRRQYPQELRAAAGEAITRRTTGVDAMLEALSTRYDYVREIEAPPVGLLARGLAAAHERRAVPGLIAHLNDPATPWSDLPAIVAALRELGDPAAVAPLIDFVRLYHVDTGSLASIGGGDLVDDRHLGQQEPLDAALEQAVLAIGALGGEPERRGLESVGAHPRTAESVRAAVARVQRGDTDPGPATPTNPTPTPGTTPTPMRHVTGEQIERAFFDERGALFECLRGARSRPAMVRIQFRYSGAGEISNVVVNPATFQACMAPIAERVRLPETAAMREIGTFTFSTTQ